MSNWDSQEKSGTGYAYDEANLLYDSPIDPDSGSIVLYDGIGTAAAFTNLIKH
jgi:hypothetical protein